MTSGPKLHHYVPRFYLRRFVDAAGRLWAWDKVKDVTFPAGPGRVAEANFYKMKELEDAGHDPHTMEKQLADLERNAAVVTEQWLDWFTDAPVGTQIDIPDPNRVAVSLFLAVQYLRTAETRDIVCALSGNETPEKRLSSAERTRLHRALLWDLDVVHSIRDRIRDSIWVFGRNETETPFITSDNPVTFRTPDNRQWLRIGMFSPGIYVVYPLSPDVVMYCFDRGHPKWGRLTKFDGCLSPVQFNRGMVESENAGQVFMATRFIFSQMNDFKHARDFARSIGTDRYAPRPRTKDTRRFNLGH
jgi:hypothetical protein